MAKWPDLTGSGMLHTRVRQSRTGPTINRGKGNNNAETPAVFINAVTKKFGPLDVDLAANIGNHKAPLWLGPGSTITPKLGQPPPYNSFDFDCWHTLSGLCWLNPPFTNITPWAKKCSEEVQLGARILLLVPASVGANWYWDWVVPFADVYSVGRMVFDNCYDKYGKLITTPYPKDLILCHYDWSAELKNNLPRLNTGSRNADLAELIRWRWQDGS